MEANEEPMLQPTSVDHLIESCIPSTTFYQLFQATLIFLTRAFDAQQTFNTVFTDTAPTWHCTDPKFPACTSATNPCTLPEGTWAWTLPKHASIVSEWNLQCSPNLISGLPTSSYFMGCFIGGLFLSTISDSWLGRKNMLFLSCLCTACFSSLTPLSNNVWTYSFLKFMTGVARANIPSTSLVLATEIVGKRWRERIGICGFWFFPLGFLSLPGIAYLNRGSSWRYLYIWISIPFIFYSIFLYFYVQESPRWLLVSGHRDEAIATLKLLSQNCAVIDFNFEKSQDFKDEKGNVININAYSTMKIIWEKKWVFRRILAAMVSGLGIGMVYYGLPLNLGNLGSNLYVSVTYNALSEFPSVLLTYIMIGKVNRRTSMLLLTAVSCLGCLLCSVGPNEIFQLSAEIGSFVTVKVAYGVLLIYSTELFPTCIKMSAVSMVYQAPMLGAVIAPLVVAQGTKMTGLSFGVFGLVIGVCGLSVTWLPETKGSRATDTIEEEEQKHTAVSGL